MAASDISVDISQAMSTQPVAAGDWLIVAPLVITAMGGALCLMLRKNTRVQPLVGIAVLVLLVAACGGLLARVIDHGVLTMVAGNWLPPFGIAFTVDPVGATLAFSSSVVALAAGVYAMTDIDISGRRYGFYPFLLLMMTGVCGAFLTGDLFNLYVWFEVLLISSFGLLVLGNERSQLDGAVKYALLNIIATTLFLIATGLLYGILGTLNMADIAIKVSALGMSRTAAHGRCPVLPRLRHEGGGLPGELLAAGLLPHAAHRRGGGLRRFADQGRRLCAAAHLRADDARGTRDPRRPDRPRRHCDHADGRMRRDRPDGRAPAAWLPGDLRHRFHAGGTCHRHHAGARRRGVLRRALDHRDDGALHGRRHDERAWRVLFAS